jgi:hypothetical protein
MASESQHASQQTTLVLKEKADFGMSFFHMHLGESQNLLAQFAYEIFSG